jgi:glycerol-3-phosphate dehydrogenase (NAD(P)+)
VTPWVYWSVRAVLEPLIRLYFWVGAVAREHVPRKGPVLIASNHRSFLDPFVIGVSIRRPIYFMAKRELFDKRWQGWLLNCLGAFPVRRGEADEDSMATARALLERGEVVVIFPEGTRIRTGSLGRPKSGVGCLALETGAPVVPTAVINTERARRGWRIKPTRVRLRFGRPLTFPLVEAPSHHLAAEATARIWPCVELQWEWLGGLPPLRKAAVIGAGPMGIGLAVLLERAGLDVQLGCHTAAQADRLAAQREDSERLPGLELPADVTVSTVADIEFAGIDLVVLAVPSRALPAAVAEVGAYVGSRSAVLVASKGLVGPLGTRPTRYVAERVRARAVATIGGPTHARETVTGGAWVVLASSDRDFRDQLAKVLARADLRVDRTDDVVGTELAGCAKNAAALAAAAAAHEGMNAAGAAAGRVFAEVHTLARRSGARGETFAGLAGAGDLVATVLAEHSRNRRAGELLGRGVPTDQIPARLGATAEALDTTPLLARLLDDAGLQADATSDLAALIEGRMPPEEWASHAASETHRVA